jgi:uncharacterized protein (DUF1800 family)
MPDPRTKLKLRGTIALLMAGVSVCAASAAPSPSALSPHDLALLNRISWGASQSSAAEMARLGPKRWLQEQLHPSSDDRLPPAAQAEIDALPISHTDMAHLAVDMQAQQQAANKIEDPTAKGAAQQAYQKALNVLNQQTAARSLLRDLYSPDQLKEQMTWFWMNHFNVHVYKRDIRTMIADYEDRVVRPRALGKFRDLLEADLRSPAMQRYLDNDTSANGKINENYAREIMELHTLGVGSGYSQQDVQELARILTGVGVDLNPTDPKMKPEWQRIYVRAGLFEFNPQRHDFGDKTFLGHQIHGSGYDEVRQALDLLAREPATAKHVSTQIATYFMGDSPPPSVIDRMTRTWKDSDGDMARVLEALFTSREFDASLSPGAPRPFKDPVHYTVSAVREAYDQRVIVNSQPMQNWINRMGEGLYNHQTPDGYPMDSTSWNGPGQMAVRFEIARQIGSGSAGLFKPEGDGQKDLPAFPQLQNALYYGGLDQLLGAPTKTALDQAVSPQDWNTLFLSSPEFMRR